MIYAKIPESLILEETPEVLAAYCRLYLLYLRRGRALNLSQFARESGLSYSKSRRLLKVVKSQTGQQK